MLQKILKKKTQLFVLIIALVILIITFYCIYVFLINPTDEMGYRCQTFYNQNTHNLPLVGEIDILNESCFVADCCNFSSIFRTKMTYDDLQKQKDEFEKRLKEQFKSKNSNFEVELILKDGKLFREYLIYYH